MKTVDDPSSSSASSKPIDAGAGAAGTSQASIAAGASQTSTAEEESDERKSEYTGFYKRASLSTEENFENRYIILYNNKSY